MDENPPGAGPSVIFTATYVLQAILGQRVPVLVITGDTAPDRLREAQASGYPLLHKPVQPAKLRSIMYQLIGL